MSTWSLSKFWSIQSVQSFQIKADLYSIPAIPHPCKAAKDALAHYGWLSSILKIVRLIYDEMVRYLLDFIMIHAFRMNELHLCLQIGYRYEFSASQNSFLISPFVRRSLTLERITSCAGSKHIHGKYRYFYSPVCWAQRAGLWCGHWSLCLCIRS